ncbi:hypothetical protein QMT40_000539 [Parvibaculaceae bacterium PLY_AMNH_Bact1]|nr:hypothetical protein QMT40_000539 [Parvibaculaceae bacterium PLY_AMNH_Bact1]
MTKRHKLTLNETLASFGAGALLVLATLGIAAGLTSAQAGETAGPDAVTVLVEYSPLSRGYADEAGRFTMPVYFSRQATVLTEEADVALGALADEAASYAAVAVTVRSQGDDDQAVAVYDALYEYGVPARVMALELDEDVVGDRDTDVLASAI